MNKESIKIAILKSKYFIIIAILLSAGIYIYWNSDNVDGHASLLLNYPQYEGPSHLCEQSICSSLVDEINSSKVSIEFAVYGFRGQPEILSALLKAKDRGVKIRGIVDKDIDNNSYYPDTEEYIEKIGNVRSDYFYDLEKSKKQNPDPTARCERPNGTEGQISCFSLSTNMGIISISQAAKEKIKFRGDIMHNKFFIFDNKTVWTGSTNISDTGTGGYNANASIIINDASVANWYKSEFEQMYSLNKYHTDKRNTPHTKTFGNGSSISVYFSPENKLFDESIIRKINEAKKDINISIFFLTHKTITTALADAHRRGVKIRIIIDSTGASNEYSKHQILRTIGIEVKVEDFGGKMHAKIASFDKDNLIIGSTNWTSAGEIKNDENMIVIEKAPGMVREYNRWFNNLWDSIGNESLQNRPLAESLASGNSCFDGIDNDFDNLIDKEDNYCNTNVDGYVTDKSPQIFHDSVSVEPMNIDDCPPDAPIKGNNSTHDFIYHVPGGEYYNVTNPEKCFFTEEDASGAGYRKSKK